MATGRSGCVNALKILNIIYWMTASSYALTGVSNLASLAFFLSYRETERLGSHELMGLQ